MGNASQFDAPRPLLRALDAGCGGSRRAPAAGLLALDRLAGAAATTARRSHAQRELNVRDAGRPGGDPPSAAEIALLPFPAVATGRERGCREGGVLPENADPHRRAVGRGGVAGKDLRRQLPSERGSGTR